MNSDSGGWLTMSEACRRLKLSRATVLRLIDRGDLPAYRIGWMIRLRSDDVHAYLGRRAEGAGEGEGEGDQPPG